MVVGTGLVDFRIPGCSSLKEKRGVLARLIKRTQNTFNCSIAEVGENDHWRKARIGFALVGNDAATIDAKMDHILKFLDSLGVAEIVRSRCEIVSFADLLAGPDGIEEGKYE
jgi:uncharacterized protein YlxP (DUF503 family)